MRTQLAEACRIASNWITDHPGTAHRGTHRGENSVFLADTVKVTRSELHKHSKSTSATEKSPGSGISCFVCGEGHKASKCPKKFDGDEVLVTKICALAILQKLVRSPVLCYFLMLNKVADK